MVKISIVVPVYNTELYLKKCIDSLLNQTFVDIEIIAIDDGSSDKSGNILDGYQKNYPEKVRVYHQDNQGISAVRNRGISLAQGKYIAFVDSDDSIHPGFCEMMIQKIEAGNLDIVTCDYFEVRGKEKKRICLPDAAEHTVYERPELLFDINTSPWNKLYNIEFLRKSNIYFPLGLKYEDAVFIHKIFARGAKMGHVNVPLVYYAIRSGSETTIVKNNVFDIFEILNIISEAYKKSGKEDYEKIYSYLEYFAVNRITVYNLQQIYQKEPGMGEKFISAGFQYLDENFPQWRNNEYFNKNNSLIKRLIKKHRFITKSVVRVVKIIAK